jgi:hypothetical protein
MISKSVRGSNRRLLSVKVSITVIESPFPEPLTMTFYVCNETIIFLRKS